MSKRALRKSKGMRHCGQSVVISKSSPRDDDDEDHDKDDDEEEEEVKMKTETSMKTNHSSSSRYPFSSSLIRSPQI
jgi:hypothetical protein